MIKLTQSKIKFLHTMLCRETGGDAGIRDEGLLDSAIEGAFQTFDDVELYPSIEQKGAWLGYSIISNHAFVDGNKRVGVLAMLVFLELNGVKVKTSSQEVVRIGLALASGEMKYTQLLDWINKNK